MINTSGDPPSTCGAAELGVERVDGLGGGAGTMPLDGVAWQLVAGTDHTEDGTVESLEHLEHLLEVSPDVAGPMMLGTLVRLRGALAQIPRDAAADAPVMISAADAVLLARSVLRGLR